MSLGGIAADSLSRARLCAREVNGESKGGDGRGNAASECEGSDGQFMQGLMARKRDGRAAMGVKSSSWEGQDQYKYACR